MFGIADDLHAEHIEDRGLDAVSFVSGGISQPVSIIVRPLFGTRFYPLPVTAFGAALMLFLPALIGVFDYFTRMIPFAMHPAVMGMFSVASFAQLYYLAMLAHGMRLARRVIDPSREAHSEYEGPALPFFGYLPKGMNFWFTRIIWEPAFVLIAAIVLQDLFIIQPALALYFKFAALAMFMHSFTAWFRAWRTMRTILDIKSSAPLIAKVIGGTATDKEAEPLHYASIPRTVDPEIRKATIAQLARNYMQE